MGLSLLCPVLSALLDRIDPVRVQEYNQQVAELQSQQRKIEREIECEMGKLELEELSEADRVEKVVLSFRVLWKRLSLSDSVGGFFFYQERCLAHRRRQVEQLRQDLRHRDEELLKRKVENGRYHVVMHVLLSFGVHLLICVCLSAEQLARKEEKLRERRESDAAAQDFLISTRVSHGPGQWSPHELQASFNPLTVRVWLRLYLCLCFRVCCVVAVWVL